MVRSEGTGRIRIAIGRYYNGRPFLNRLENAARLARTPRNNRESAWRSRSDFGVRFFHAEVLALWLGRLSPQAL